MIYQHPKVLLGMKKRRFGVGRWNGFGGKIEKGETLEQAATRELKEEVGIEAVKMEKQGILEFSFESDPAVLEVHIFRVTEFRGEPIETEEMKPQWFHVDHIPFEQMWSDDIHWFPFFLAGQKFRGKFLFDRPSNAEYSAKILKQELREVKKL